MTQHMLAAAIEAYGGPEVLRPTQIPVPEPGPGEVQIAVQAAGVNPADWKTRTGAGIAIPSFPAILGWDVAGIVTAAGPGVHKFVPGDQVFGMPAFPRLAGTYAEYTVAHVNELARIPPGVPIRSAAGAPLVTLTAWQALFGAANLTSGQRLLVNAAAGGVGHVAVQLARHAGAEVIGVASARNRAYLESLGVAEIIDYTTEPAARVARAVDVVLDTHGGNPTLADALRPGGTFVSIVATHSDLAPLRARGLVAKSVLVHPDGEQLARMAALLGNGHLVITIDQTFPLAEAAAAHHHAEHGHVRGKVVLDIQDVNMS